MSTTTTTTTTTFTSRAQAEEILAAGKIPSFIELVDEHGDAHVAGIEGNAFATYEQAWEAAEALDAARDPRDPEIDWDVREVTRSVEDLTLPEITAEVIARGESSLLECSGAVDAKIFADDEEIGTVCLAPNSEGVLAPVGTLDQWASGELTAFLEDFGNLGARSTIVGDIVEAAREAAETAMPCAADDRVEQAQR